MSFMSSQGIRRISQEIHELVTSPPEGVKVSVNEEDITDITALIRGPVDTPFENGVFKIKLKLGQDFPSAPPKGAFVTKIFHPNVSAKGEICVNTLKKDWQPEMGIKHVLLTIKCLLINPNPESALNEEAGRLLIENYDDYFKHAKLMTSVHGTKIKWEETSAAAASSSTNEANKSEDPASEEDDTRKENVNTAAVPTSAAAATKAKPAAPAAAPKKTAAALKQNKSLKRL